MVKVPWNPCITKGSKSEGINCIRDTPNTYGIFLVCEPWYALEDFSKRKNRIRRHRARGRFISPYQIGGTIFDKSTMARYPLMYTSSRLLDPHSMMIKNLKQRRRMKGGTIFGKSERMRYPLMYPSSRVNPQWMITMARCRNAIKRKRH